MIQNVCLEITLKPFKDKTAEGYGKACETLFRQWLPLTVNAETISVLLWISDGSEILDYNRDMDATFEWACVVGSANPHPKEGDDSIDSKPFFYCENPPEYCYRDLKRLIASLKSTALEICGKPLRVGAIFDPGPEFAKSTFKYERHPEICTGNPSCTGTSACGRGFVYSAERLKGDSRPYAGFPNGIPDGTPFGAFLGRQVKCYFKDLDFDFLWLSNGFGFGKDTWGIIGSTFDKAKFSSEQGPAVRAGIMEFWREFRNECPDIPLQTRGTNSTTGVDISTDGVPLREIYSQVSDLEVPPNSPWGPLTNDFGLELAGWMSHIAEVPSGKSYLFRYYIHDPWWAFSPWLHQYQRKAHDLYLPLAITRLDANGKTKNPENIAFLSVDNSYGELLPQVPNEVIPEILACYETSPDEPGPFVWLYPFDDYHDLAFKQNRYEEVFFGDLFIRDAINLGFPLNTIVSTGNFLSSLNHGASYSKCVLVAPTAIASNKAVLEKVEKLLGEGAQILLYGPVGDAALLEFLEQERCEGIEGDMEIHIGERQLKVRHTALLSGGDLNVRTKSGSTASTLAEYVRGSERRSAAVRIAKPAWKGGKLIWIRGTNSFSVAQSGFNTVMFDSKELFLPETLMREILPEFGYTVEFTKHFPQQTDPVINFRRHANAIHMAAYSADMTVGMKLNFPEGAPVFTSSETILEEGLATYRPGKAVNWECRVFVEQSQGLVKCLEREPRAKNLKRKLQVDGLENATLHFRPEPGFENATIFTREGADGNGPLAIEQRDLHGPVLELRNLSGSVVIAW